MGVRDGNWKSAEGDMADVRMWVVFTDQSDLFLVRLLRRGFRHCFVLIREGSHYISVDPMAHYMDVSVHDVPWGFDLPEWLAAQGHLVVPVAGVRAARVRAAPWGFFTCVEVCKRILGIHKRFIVTPWQLYRYLQRL